jgi:hypothetical protein
MRCFHVPFIALPAMPYSAFDHPVWKLFFHALCSCYQLPTRNQIGGELMMYEYTKTMNKVLLSLGKNPLICFTLDGATNLQGKQVINMMACVPKAFFLEHFTMQLRRESAGNLLEKLLDCSLRLLGSIVCQRLDMPFRVTSSQSAMLTKTTLLWLETMMLWGHWSAV